jgi:hypothetical protein
MKIKKKYINNIYIMDIAAEKQCRFVLFRNFLLRVRLDQRSLKKKQQQKKEQLDSLSIF